MENLVLAEVTWGVLSLAQHGERAFLWRGCQKMPKIPKMLKIWGGGELSGAEFPRWTRYHP
jgi:hypothetical protein